MTATNLSLQPIVKIYSEHQNKIILAIVILLSLYLLSFAAQLTWRFIPQAEITLADQTLNNSALNTQNTSRLDISPLLKLNLFGDPAQRPVKVVETEITEAPETQLNLTLTGVVSSTDPKVGAAIVENNGKQNTYGVGDKIDGTNAILDELYVDRVIIKNSLSRETLMLDGIDFNEANRGRQESARTEVPQGPIVQQSGAQNAERSAQSAKQMRQQISQSPSNFADFINIQPHSRDGEMIGYQLSPGKQPNFFQDVGLRSGDIVTEINGLVMSDPAQSLEAITVLKEAQSLQLEVLRGDEALSLSIDIPSSEE